MKRIHDTGMKAVENGIRPRALSRGFTLIELLMAIGIFLVLITLTAYMIRTNNDSDKVSAASRLLQAYMEGAKAKAFQKANSNKDNTSSKRPKDAVGIRFFKDKTDNTTVSTMVYLEYKEVETGTLEFLNTALGTTSPRDGSIVKYQSVGGTLDWKTLNDNGLFGVGSKFRSRTGLGGIGNSPYEYTVTDVTNISSNIVYIHPEFKQVNIDTFPTQSYVLELFPSPMENAKPIELPKGTTIDLDNSVNISASTNPEYFDLIFAPNGSVDGAAAAAGVIRLVLARTEDTDQQLNVKDIYNKDEQIRGDQLIISIYTHSGAITVSPVDMTSSSSKGTSYPYQQADNPFKFAEKGEEAK